MYEVLISDGTTTLHFSLYTLWGTGLHGVVVSLARRKTDEFDSRVLHQLVRIQLVSLNSNGKPIVGKLDT